MKSYPLVLLAFAVLTVSTFTTCKKETIPTFGLPLGIMTENGCLVFRDIHQLDSVIDVTQNMQGEEALTWQQQFDHTDFQSFGSVYQRARMELQAIIATEKFYLSDQYRKKWEGKVIFEDNLNIKPILKLEHMRNILNMDGIIKVGDHYMKYFNDKIAIAAEPFFSELSSVDAYFPDMPLDHVNILPIKRHLVMQFGGATDQALSDRSQLSSVIATTNGNSSGSRRVKGELEVIENILSAAEVGSNFSGCTSFGQPVGASIGTLRARVLWRIESEYKSWTGWHNEDSMLDINGSGVVTDQNDPNYSQSWSINLTPVYDDERVFSNNIGPTIPFFHCNGSPFPNNFKFQAGTTVTYLTSAVSGAVTIF